MKIELRRVDGLADWSSPTTGRDGAGSDVDTRLGEGHLGSRVAPHPGRGRRRDDRLVRRPHGTVVEVSAGRLAADAGRERGNSGPVFRDPK